MAKAPKAVSAKVGAKKISKPTSDASPASATKAVELEIASPADDDEENEEDLSSSSDEEHEEGKDVSNKGLARLMAVLGEDGLSEDDQARLQAMQMAQDENEEDEDDEDEDEEEEDDEVDEEEDEDDDEVAEIEKEEIQSKPKSSGGSLAESLARAGLIPQEESEEEESDDEEEEDREDEEGGVALESLSDAQLASLPESVRSNRMYREKINDEAALTRIRDDIALNGGGSSKGKSKEALPWVETLVVTYDKSIEAQLEAQGEGSSENDLKRELEFYKQALYTATEGRKLAKASNLPFTRPSDYYAEMIKSDEHMERVRQRLLDERAGIKAAEEAKKQRELKKFGKKVQVEKQLERQKSKKDMEERVKGLKRKRQGGLDGADDDGDDDGFNIRLETAISGQDEKASSRGGNSKDARGGKARAKMPRDSRNAKFGFGGKKKYSKENTRESTNDVRSGPRKPGGSSTGSNGTKGKRAPAKRPGKSKRTARR